MRDLALLVMMLGLAGVVWRTPWTGVLALSFLGYMHPHGYAAGFMRHAPVFAIFFGLTIAAALAGQQRPWSDWLAERQWLLKDWRVLVLTAFWLFAALTSYLAPVPAVAWPHWWDLTKALASISLTLLLIDDFKKLEALLLVIALAIGLIALKGGYWALLQGAQDRVYGSPGGHFYDNNHFAIANLMALPLLGLGWSRGASTSRRWVFGALFAASVLAVLSSWSRGALLSLGATLFVMALTAGKRWVMLAVIAGLVLATIGLMPEDWLQRMSTIADYQADGSAVSRLAAWRQGIAAGLDRPWFGLGFNSGLLITERIDWHSAYVAVFAEQGVFGISLWVTLFAGTWLMLVKQLATSSQETRCEEGNAYARALLASLIAYGVGAAFLGIAYWDIGFHLVGVSVLLTRFRHRGQRLIAPG